uniref:Secreted protein n=1 Tax=Parascaris univalens TaxID=6257 RepID=A0A914ZJ49_PARUN
MLDAIFRWYIKVSVLVGALFRCSVDELRERAVGGIRLCGSVVVFLEKALHLWTHGSFRGASTVNVVSGSINAITAQELMKSWQRIVRMNAFKRCHVSKVTCIKRRSRTNV